MLRRAIPSVVTLLLGVAVVAWTVWLPTSLDALWPWHPVAEGSTGGLLAVIWANVLQPVVAYIIMFFLVGVLFRRRWRDLSGSMLLAIGLTVSITTVLKSLVGRTRPDTPWIGHLDALASYPSGHAAAGTALAIGIVQTTWALSRHLRTTVLVAVASALLAAAVAIGRLVLSVHHVSDVLGGAIVALFSAALAATVTGAWNTTRRSRIHGRSTWCGIRAGCAVAARSSASCPARRPGAAARHPYGSPPRPRTTARESHARRLSTVPTCC